MPFITENRTRASSNVSPYPSLLQVVDLGPITQWNNATGMEGGENNVIISMRCGQRDIEFNLVRPGPEYLPLYEKTFRMVYMANRIIVELLDVNERGGSMEYRCRSCKQHLC